MNTLSLFNPSFTSDVFDAFDRGLGLFAPLTSTQGSVPRVDVRETNESYLMDMDLPGMTENDVEINLKDRTLTIASIVDTKNEEKKKVNEQEFLIRERHSTSFSRRFTLPQDIDAEQVHAEFKNGVLSINIPRRPETQPRQIAIKTAS